MRSMIYSLTKPKPTVFCEPMTDFGASKRHSDFRPLRDNDSEQWLSIYQEAKNALKYGGTFAFVGERGNGKTQAAISLMAYFNYNFDLSVRYTTAHDLFLALMGTFSGHERGKGEPNPAESFFGAKMLVIDALEVRKESAFEMRELSNLIDKRYGDPKKITVLISNDKPENLAEFIGISSIERMKEDGGIITFTGNNFRRKENSK